MTKQILALILFTLPLNVNAAETVINWSGKVKSIAVQPSNVEVKSGYIDYDLDEKHIHQALSIDKLNWTPPTLEKEQLIVYRTNIPLLSLEL
ncbi:hypothetical protein [Vibrio hyugaensis]|uniref:Uncharacterized protein n=1 Tax=Vibrio hyugaensis TaxID=1534743 RepID=A0ABQ5Y8S8_9VIBR|nr:hypothetical protein [Vibrio hyugaensis]GLR05816.1 hypothetical protein GCM10007906_34040 [Vibrio hyugaensis]